MREYTVTFLSPADLVTVVREINDSLGWPVLGINLNYTHEDVWQDEPVKSSTPEAATPSSTAVDDQLIPAADEEQLPNPTPVEDEDVDVNGVAWDPEIHSANKTKNKDGTWRLKKGASKSDAPIARRRPEPATEVLGQEEPASALNDHDLLDREDDEPVEITMDLLKAKFTTLYQEKGMEVCMNLLGRYDAKKLSALDEEHFTAVHTEILNLLEA